VRQALQGKTKDSVRVPPDCQQETALVSCNKGGRRKEFGLAFAPTPANLNLLVETPYRIQYERPVWKEVEFASAPDTLNCKLSAMSCNYQGKERTGRFGFSLDLARRHSNVLFEGKET